MSISSYRVAYGAEVKNSWDYIPRDELRLKLRMCEFLRVKPLMIMRYAAKSYIYEIGQRGGYGMIFVAHIFPMGQEKLVGDIKKEFGMPCDAPRRIPEGRIENGKA